MRCNKKDEINLSFDWIKDQLCGRQSGMSDEVHHLLQELTTLNRHENAKVALRARQVSCIHTECDESASFW